MTAMVVVENPGVAGTRHTDDRVGHAVVVEVGNAVDDAVGGKRHDRGSRGEVRRSRYSEHVHEVGSDWLSGLGRVAISDEIEIAVPVDVSCSP